MPEFINLFSFAAVTAAEGNPFTDIMGLFKVDLWTLLAQIINFLIVASIIYFLGAKPILATLDARQKKISDGLQFAEDARIRLEEVEKQAAEALRNASLEAQTLINEARDTSKKIIEKETRDAATKAENMITKAQEAIELEKQKMLGEVRQEVTRLVVETTRKVLRKDLSDAEKSRFAESASRELASSGN